jgi:hypothetical protein
MSGELASSASPSSGFFASESLQQHLSLFA